MKNKAKVLSEKERLKEITNLIDVALDGSFAAVEGRFLLDQLKTAVSTAERLGKRAGELGEAYSNIEQDLRRAEERHDTLEKVVGLIANLAHTRSFNAGDLEEALEKIEDKCTALALEKI